MHLTWYKRWTSRHLYTIWWIYRFTLWIDTGSLQMRKHLIFYQQTHDPFGFALSACVSFVSLVAHGNTVTTKRLQAPTLNLFSDSCCFRELDWNRKKHDTCLWRIWSQKKGAKSTKIDATSAFFSTRCAQKQVGSRVITPPLIGVSHNPSHQFILSHL